ncbi:MAG: YgjV family protein [Oscillospiraceae bacterium]|nr:YgjV family protein [Oscillospiraceae bacterium]
MDWMFIIVQALGIISLILGVIMVQQKKKENLLILMALMFVVLGIQYILTNKITGLVIAIIIIVRNMIYLYYAKKDLKPSLTVLLIFQVILFASIFLTWQNAFSLLPATGTMAITWGTWQNNMKRNRGSILYGKICFAIYALIAGMYTATLGHSLEVISVLIAMWKYDRKKAVES